MNGLKKFLDRVSEKASNDIINWLDVNQIRVLMSLPGFESNNGLSETVHKVGEILTAKGFSLKDGPVVELFKRGCLQWIQEGETCSVCQSLCGKANKDAIVSRFITLQRGGDGSEAFKSFFMGGEP